MKTQGKVWLFFDSEEKHQTQPMSLGNAQSFILSLNQNTIQKWFIWTPGWDEWIRLNNFLNSSQIYFTRAQPPAPTRNESRSKSNSHTNSNSGINSNSSSKISAESEGHTNTKTHSGAKSGIKSNSNDGEKRNQNADDTITITRNTSYTIKDKLNDFTHVVMEKTEVFKETNGHYHKDFNGHDLNIDKVREIKITPSTKQKIIREDPKKNIDSIRKPDRRKELRHKFKIEVILLTNSGSFRSHSKDISLSGTQLEDEIPIEFAKTSLEIVLVNPFESDRTKDRILFRGKVVGDPNGTSRLMFLDQNPDLLTKLNALLKAYLAYQKELAKKAV